MQPKPLAPNAPAPTTRPPPRMLTVLRNRALTPHMRRVTLGGPELDGFPEGRESANFKLFLPRPGQREPLLVSPLSDTDPSERPIVRTYTLRRYDPARAEVEVDFVVHTDYGPATAWAVDAKPGDRVGCSTPSAPKPVNPDADWVLFVGDMSALPAIAANIEQLPRGITGYAVLEILDAADRQPLDFPSGIEVQWIVNPDPATPSDRLLNAVRALDWLEGEPGVWAAGESHAIKALKLHFKQERGVTREQIYISGYWQLGLTEDAHQKIKRLDAEY